MDQQDNIYLWMVLLTTMTFVTAIVLGIMKISEYKEQLSGAFPF